MVEESNLFNERNKINDLVIDNNICIDQKLINNHIFDYYKTIYSLKDSSVNLKDYKFNIDPISDKKLIEQTNTDYSINEFYEIIDEMEDSSPGPNGLTRLFYKKF